MQEHIEREARAQKAAKAASLIEEARQKADAGIPLTEDEMSAAWESMKPAIDTFAKILEALAAVFGQLVSHVDWEGIARALEANQEPTRPLIHNGRKPR
ncbi:hypothetical protein QEO77_gp46 [Arthrobacter phage Zaheer]|uniref:Uncharacterized protein n=1 Tax=Arthrobacter phage Zaheer TaxID=2836041 RepID=A0A8F3E8P5_9CAUD|nr:hypothetical protein QEO77_gp46 [Arthrobacter phage Zaheer]QWY84257.1 hypothetical protein SEA_ZAHEER_61 [Arthrobacter phage Zaheer]